MLYPEGSSSLISIHRSGRCRLPAATGRILPFFLLLLSFLLTGCSGHSDRLMTPDLTRFHLTVYLSTEQPVRSLDLLLNIQTTSLYSIVPSVTFPPDVGENSFYHILHTPEGYGFSCILEPPVALDNLVYRLTLYVTNPLSPEDISIVKCEGLGPEGEIIDVVCDWELRQDA
ncbi:MAG TPA: hypothetical protein PK014_13835 [Thermoanaerobaculia bacterium]|nr:hypothetical protein [Thermoanaerobaculia bacterium]HUM31125.1 hypothetical protein [Thermoanaerobaculia bacterium]HXK69476.1 hypothetical protein [Thermoanaerobaculia bacterium]